MFGLRDESMDIGHGILFNIFPHVYTFAEVISSVWSVFFIPIHSDGLSCSEWRLSGRLDEKEITNDHRQKNIYPCP